MQDGTESPGRFAPLGESDCDRRLPLSMWLLLIVFTLTLYSFHLGSERTFTGHECYVAEAAREMVVTGDWLVPRIAGEPWLEKPPLPHWIVAAVGYCAGRVDEFTARLPSALAALIGILLITKLAVQWFGATRGLLTGFIQATSVYTATYARLAESDIYLWVLVVGCLFLFARGHVEPAAPPRWFNGPAVFFVLLGLTQMVKGPMFGAVLVLVPCIGFVALHRRWSAWRWFCSWRGLLLFVVISIAWPAAILLRYPEAWDLWKLHTFGRFGEQCLNPEAWWYYGTTIPWQVLPWTLLVPIALPGSWRRAWQGPTSPDRFLWLWFLLPLMVLSAAKAKHHHYLLYALPPCSFWAAGGLLQLRRLADRMADWKGRLWFGWGAVAVILAAGVLICRSATPEFGRDAAVLAGVLITSAAAVTAAWLRRRYQWVLAGIFGVCWLVYGYVHIELMRKTDRYRDETALFRRLNGSEYDGARLLIYGYEPARILLYCRLPVERYELFEQLRKRYDELPRAYLTTSLGHAALIEALAEVTCVDRASHGRWENSQGFTQLGIFRLRWRPPVQPAKPATPASYSP